MTEKKAKIAEQKVDLAYLRSARQGLGRTKEHSGRRQDSLAARLRAGDCTAAAELVDMYYEQIYLFMRRLGHDRQISEDLTQESFLNAWHHIGQLRDGKALNSWLYRIAANISKLYWRKHKQDRATGIEGIDVLDDSESGPDKVGHYEQLKQLNDAVARLPAKLRQTIVLHYMQQLTIAEAAEAAGVRNGTFKSRLSKALKTLRKHVV